MGSAQEGFFADLLEIKEERNQILLKLLSQQSLARNETLIGKVEDFLREMDGMFAFIGRQFRLRVSGKEYFIDLLLYHRQLRSLVAIELKIGEFLPEHVGKMQFYLAVLNDKVRLEDENPAIGMILCKDKDQMIVEYALEQTTSPLGIAEYKLVSTLPENLQKQLPAPEQIAKVLDIIEK